MQNWDDEHDLKKNQLAFSSMQGLTFNATPVQLLHLSKILLIHLYAFSEVGSNVKTIYSNTNRLKLELELQGNQHAVIRYQPAVRPTKPSTVSHFKNSTIQTNLLWWALMQYRLWIYSLALWQKLQRAYSADKCKEGEQKEGVRDAGRYRDESRCGLWAETAESPRLFSLLYHIANLEHFLWSQTQSACHGKRRREAGKRDETEEKPTKGRRPDKQWRAQTSRGSDEKEIPHLLPLPPFGADIPLKGPAGHRPLLHPPHWLGSVT